MREDKGKVIAIWNPVFHRQGSSALVSTIGAATSLYFNKSTLIIDLANTRSQLNNFFENDLDVKYSLDSIAPLGKEVCLEDIKVYATNINDKLSFLPGLRLEDHCCNMLQDYIKQVLNVAKKGYDYIVLDLKTGLNEETKEILDNVDTIIANVSLDAIKHMDDDVMKYIKMDKTICSFNKVPKELLEIVEKYAKEELELKNAIAVPLDAGIYFAQNISKNTYTYLYENINKRNDRYISTVLDLAFMFISMHDTNIREILDGGPKSWISKLFKIS